MEIEIQSQDLIDAISERLSKTLIELETTKIALRQTQEVANNLTRALNEMIVDYNTLEDLTNKAIELPETKEHPGSQ